ncbi:MAG: hypothetical protein ALAOOOJD_01132 [bacterium]|nr:hypothetical protein [bacterium]
MREMKIFVTALLSLLPAALVAQTGTLPEQLNRLNNPAHYQQRADAGAALLQTFGQSDVIGLNGAVMTYGGGSNFHYQWPLQKDLAATLDLALVYLNLDNPFLPFYTRYRNSGDVMLVPFFFGLRREVWRESFDGMLPYVQFGAGPLAGIAFPYGYSFWNSLRYSTAEWTIGGFVGAGFNFALDKKTVGLVDFRYNIMMFPEQVGPRSNYSGPAIAFGVLR